MRARTVAAAALLLAALPAAVAAQNCDLSSGQLNRVASGTPQEMTFIGGGVTFTCPDGKVIRADSAVLVAATEQRFLIGHAYYADAEKALSADRINYFAREKHLNAQLHVVLNDRVNGATIQGDYLDYYLANGPQTPSRTYVYGGRPHAVWRAKPGADGAPRADTTSTVVDADRMEIQGQDNFHAMGNVVLTRGPMKGTASEVEYAPADNHVRLIGNARIEGERFALTGGTLDGTLVGNTFKDVTATFQAQLQSEDLTVKGSSVAIAFADGQVERLVALSPERTKRTATDGSGLAEATSREFKLVADSIDALAPGEKLEKVVAVGRAYGERQNDSIATKLPDIVSKDWLRGDTIVATFVAAAPSAAKAGGKVAGKPNAAVRAAPPRAPADTAQRVLERIVASGGTTPASSAYRIVDEKQPKGMPAVNYLLAQRIAVAFRDGEVHEVHAEGQIRGLHLEPTPPAPAKKPDERSKPTTNSVARSPAGSTGSGKP